MEIKHQAPDTLESLELLFFHPTLLVGSEESTLGSVSILWRLRMLVVLMIRTKQSVGANGSNMMAQLLQWRSTENRPEVGI